MGRRLVALGLGVVAVLAWKASRGDDAKPTPAVVVAHRDARVFAFSHVVEHVEPDQPIEEDEPVEEEIVDEGDGLTDDQRWEGQVAIVEDALAPNRGALHGITTDARTGELMAGVTVIATSPNLEGAQTAITDEHGYYAITGLRPGEYTLTFYYAEITIERSGMMVGPDRATPAFQKIDQAAGRVYEPIVVTLDEADELSSHDTLTNTYVVDDDDELPTDRITGRESQTNTYVVDGIDTTGLTFGEGDDE
jgi:hypothetical protein